MSGQMNSRPSVLAAATLLAFVLMLPGCGTGPDVLAPQGPSVVDGSSFPPVDAATPVVAIDSTIVPAETWNLVASGLVGPDRPAVVRGSRYMLRFGMGSVPTSTLITIRERDPLVADVEFGPDGTVFDFPVEVTIDYKGTALDPASEKYTGLPVRAYWFNPATEAWELIPCEVDKKLKKVRFQVTHFSRYGLTDTVFNGEWQWWQTGGGRGQAAPTDGR